ncbi:ABC-2 type transport system permease protein [Ruminiclostridium sufflavum DSM 19573]|uniref:ABC-2 type transport system permease protein n=1 Tax=Ruminiclostridium sufflavum DSM 19573 TaxID=1121337 RepID=A0A318XNJ0_9FIRM|nr:ABC-2 family transporter protein [Ruminiclostridium sufflavum]PYG89572.1 ABC-2 type transport system permease protein [Ruminiclostridium sufflavum DSM 19573]
MEQIKAYKKIELLKILFVFFKMNLKSMLEYKFDRFFIALAIFVREMVSIVVMFLILTRFVTIGGWTMHEMFFLYSFLFLSYSIFVFFFTGIRDFDDMVYQGTLDRYLIRPLGLMFQVVAARVDFAAILGHGTVGILLFTYSCKAVGIVWDFKSVTYYISALIGGAIIQAALFMISSCFSFWTIRTVNLRNLIFFNCRRFAGYPISFYPGLVQKLLIFVVPFAFVSYFPAQYFIRKPDLDMFWNGYLYLTPLVGAAMFVLVYIFWRAGLKRYSSAGN